MATIEALSPSAAHVQAAIGAAVDGDTIVIPAGEAVYDDTHLVTCNKGLIIQGAGIDQTIIYDQTGGSWEKEPFVFTTKNGYTTQVLGFTFDGADAGFEPFKVGFPGGWGGVHIFDAPLVFIGDILSLRDGGVLGRGLRRDGRRGDEQHGQVFPPLQVRQ